jgi:hypothetical protein
MFVLGHSWLLLQPKNSQFSNCQIRNTKISAASVIPMPGIPAKRRAGPSKNQPLSPVPPVLSGADEAPFSRHVEEPWTGPDDIDISGHAHAITPELLATTR